MLAATASSAGTAEDATAAALARIATTDPKVNAVLALDPTALAKARALDRSGAPHGPLFGLPLLIKDNIETAGPLPTTAGSLALAANVAQADAPLVARLRAAGAVIVGKASLSEWANIRSSASISGWSAVGGLTRNPHALDRTACGSSSGSAAAVAAGMIPAAIGTETDGSITCPAAMTGVVGLKPTVGLVSRARVIPISASQDTPGPIAADVATAARVLTALAGTDPADPATANADAHRADYAAGLRRDALRGARIGVVRWIKGWSPGVTARFDAALSVLRAQGAILVDVPSFDGRERLGDAELTVLLTELKVGLDAYLATTPAAVTTRSLADVIAFDAAAPRELALFGQDLFVAAEATKGLDDPAYRAARALCLQVARGGLDALFARFDALVAPTTSPAWKIDAVNGDRGGPSGPGSLAAIAGTPHLTVPMGAVAGLPVGLSFLGPAWSEARLLGYGHAYEAAAGGRVTPGFAPSIETSAAVAPLFAPEKP